MKTHSKSFVYSILIFAISCISLTPFIACSNSDGMDYAGWEYYNIDSEEDVLIEPQKQDCFDSLRLPDLQSIACKKQFYSNDTVTEFPQSGFFQNTFTIVFPNKKPLNCETGGKVPTAESPLISAILIDSSTTIRCVDFSAKSTYNEIIRTYILEKAPDIATVFITTDPNSLFDPDTGIYMEGPNAEEAPPHYGANYWLDKEIPIFIELVETGASSPAFAKHAGLKIFGNFSRINAKKSVSIIFREKYGDKRLYYKLFPDHPNLNIFKSFILRNNGQNFHNDYIRDRLSSSISEGLGVDYQLGRFVIVYYNNVYYGIHDLRERSNEYYFETHYGMNHNNINMLKANNSVTAGSSDEYISLINWLKKHSLENDDNYAYIASKIDIENFINYMHIEIYANNPDWPINNLKKWNCTNPQTTWKWFLYDIDRSFGIGKSEVTNNLFEFRFSEEIDNNAKTNDFVFLFRSLLDNKKFQTAFINRLVALLQMNFEAFQILSKTQEMMSTIMTEIPRDQKRWFLKASNMNDQLKIIEQFAIDRPSHLTKHIQDYFHLEETIPITLSTNGKGNILLHELPLNKQTLTINFFKNFPVTIIAKPQNGNFWSHWSDGDTNAIKVIYPDTAKELTAIFK